MLDDKSDTKYTVDKFSGAVSELASIIIKHNRDIFIQRLVTFLSKDLICRLNLLI